MTEPRDAPGWKDSWYVALIEIERLTRREMTLIALCDLMEEGARLPSTASGDLPGIRTDVIRAALASGDEVQP